MGLPISGDVSYGGVGLGNTRMDGNLSGLLPLTFRRQARSIAFSEGGLSNAFWKYCKLNAV